MENVPAPCDAWLSVRQAALRLDVSAEHVRHLAQSQAIGSVKLGASRNATVLVDPASVEAYLARPGRVEMRRRRTTISREVLEVVPASLSKSGPIRGTRYPLRPLVVLLEQAASQPLSAVDLARIFGVHRAAVLRARTEGLSERMADRWAVHIGYHPSLVWGDDWWTAYEAQQRTESMRRHPSTIQRAARAVALGGAA